jgi:hypothetical protein
MEFPNFRALVDYLKGLVKRIEAIEDLIKPSTGEPPAPGSPQPAED